MDPPDFDLGGLGDIISDISAEDFEKISKLAGQFAGGEKNEGKSEPDNAGGFNIDPDMLFRLMEIFQRLNSQQNDPRCNLINALKPLLSPERRQKADKAIELLRIMSIFSIKDIFGME